MKTVKATKVGYHEGRRHPGDEFEIPDWLPDNASWYKLVDAKPKPEPEEAKPKRATRSKKVAVEQEKQATEEDEAVIL